MKTNKNYLPILLELISGLFILLWIYTGLSKLLGYEKFAFELGRSPFIETFAPVVSILIPIGELIIAGMLVLKKTRLLGLSFSFFLMLLFTGYIYIMLRFSYDLPCSCGGVLSQLSWNDHLIFNITFTLLAIIAIIIHYKNQSFNRVEANKLRKAIK